VPDNETQSPIPEIDDHVAENYEALIADENRTLTYERVAVWAAASNDPGLAAWARRRADEAGKNITPHGATAGTAETRAIDFEALTLPELKKLADARQIDVKGLSLKADFVAALELDAEATE